jgi:chloramphenicol-sensitive protein RarD
LPPLSSPPYATFAGHINAHYRSSGSAAIDLFSFGISAAPMHAPTPNIVPASHSDQRRERVGLLCGLAAYAAWGILPVYFKALANVAPMMIVAHRVVWSLAALLLLVTMLKGWPAVAAAARNRRVVVTLAISATLIAVNWLLYVYAINSGHVLAGSLGYYLNPLANIMLGRFFLGEILSKRQWTAVAIAAAGVAVLAAGALDTLWLSLTLCFSFATYGLLRKQVAVDSLSGLTIETVILTPVALGFLLFQAAIGAEMFGRSDGDVVLLLAAGVISTTPLLLFTEAARRLPYATVGMLQFIAPTIQFLLAVLVYDEAFTRSHAVAFTAIWIAVALYISGIVAQRRKVA